MPKVRVLVPIAVDPKGRWCAYGAGDLDGAHIAPDELLDSVDYDMVGPREKIYVLHAELEIPEPVETKAEVEAQAP